jgi:hypothetical protein
MSNITEEEGRELIIEYIRYVFEEVKTEGWKTRREKFVGVGDFWENDDDDDYTDEMTFDNMMDTYENDLNTVISIFLCDIIGNLERVWFKAWLSQKRPELDIKGDPKYWDYWTWCSLNDFIYVEKSWRVRREKVNFEKFKEVLGLDFDLK